MLKIILTKICSLVKRVAKKSVGYLYTWLLVLLAKKRASAEGKKYFFSVIIPVYNTEKYVAEAIESVLTQSIGRRITQIVLVDDGSTDGSGAICREYEKKYPGNVVFLSQKNRGVSAARNLGIDHADGLYLNFLDSDDKWDPSAFCYVLKFLKENGFPKVVAGRIRLFEKINEWHPRDYLLSQDAVRDLEKDYWAVPLSVAHSFFEYSAIAGLRFLEGMKHSEDARFANEVLLKTLSYGVASKAIYLYRKRSDTGSAVDTSFQSYYYYSDALSEYFDYFIEKLIGQTGGIPRFIQFSLAYNLGWRIREPAGQVLDADRFRDYKRHLKSILQSIDDEMIIEQRPFDLYDKLGLLALKRSVPLRSLVGNLEWNTQGQITAKINNRTVVLCEISKFTCKCRIDFFHFNEEKQTLTLEGTFPDLRLSPEQVRIEFICNERSYVPEIYPRKHRPKYVYFDEEGIGLYQLHFRVILPLEEKIAVSVMYAFRSAKDVPMQDMKMRFGQFAYLHAPFTEANYAIKAGRVLCYRGKTLFIEKEEEGSRSKYEKLFRGELLGTKEGLKWTEYRKFAIDHLHDGTKLWLFTDRMTSAEDSGEELFRYVQDHPVPNVETAFVIRKDVPDFERLAKIGKVLAFGSEEHLKAMLRADAVISSAGDEFVYNPFGKDQMYVKDLLHFDFVFLQHGVIKDDLSGWLHRCNKNIRLFVTSAERERQAVLSDPYGYGEEQVILTGLPRFDKLARKGREPREKSIYIMPTWRKWLATDFDANAKSLEATQTKIAGFRDSDYFRFYDSLLRDGRLHELLQENDIHLYFALHPRMGAEMDLFHSDERVHLLRPESFVYGDAFKEMRMLITDYSSVAFNVAFLKKPVVYAQFDYDEFYLSGKHTSKAGYFSFEEDGFGPVVKTVDAVVDEIGKAIGRSFEMDETYAKRVDDFFFRPEEGTTHCELVLDEILKMKNYPIQKSV